MSEAASLLALEEGGPFDFGGLREERVQRCLDEFRSRAGHLDEYLLEPGDSEPLVQREHVMTRSMDLHRPAPMVGIETGGHVQRACPVDLEAQLRCAGSMRQRGGRVDECRCPAVPEPCGRRIGPAPHVVVELLDLAAC